MTPQTELNDVIYNAAEQAFEGVVTLETAQGPLRYAAQFPAPITTDVDAAARGLIAQAHKMHRLNRGMRAGLIQRLSLPPLAERRAKARTGAAWLNAVFTHKRAA